jgi:hypothetical protein
VTRQTTRVETGDPAAREVREALARGVREELLAPSTTRFGEAFVRTMQPVPQTGSTWPRATGQAGTATGLPQTDNERAVALGLAPESTAQMAAAGLSPTPTPETVAQGPLTPAGGARTIRVIFPHSIGDLVVDRWASDGEGSSLLDFPFPHNVWSYNPS